MVIERPSHSTEANVSISDLVAEVSHFLPSQGPVKTFVHHNTLHHFEGLEFFDAVDMAGEIFGARKALAEASYQDFFLEGRIGNSDINRGLEEYGLDGSKWLLGGSRRKFIRSLMFGAPIPLTAETLRWRLLERGYLTRFHDEVPKGKISKILRADENFAASRRTEIFAQYASTVSEWNQPWLIEMVDAEWTGERRPSAWRKEDSLTLLWFAAIIFAEKVLQKCPDFGGSHYQPRRNSPIEELVNPYLIKFTASFLDAGLAHLTVADRTHGLLKAFLIHMGNASIARPQWLVADLSEFDDLSGDEALEKVLSSQGINRESWKEYLLQKALILKGWGGLVHQTELGVAGFSARATLSEFLAMRVILEQVASKFFASRPEQLESSGERSAFELVRPGAADIADHATRVRTTAYHLFHAFQLFPCSGSELLDLPLEKQDEIVSTVCEYDSPRRLRVWHKAYEWNLYSRAASALLHHNESLRVSGVSQTRRQKLPKCQVVCCIDDREESFRRYLEEINEEYQTFGTAGFFGVDAEFHSLYERPAPFCPVNVVPTHHVEVTAKSGSEQRLMGLQKFHTVRSEWEMFVDSQSRSLVRGWLLALGGLVALVPLSLSTLAPRIMHRFRIYLKKVLLNPSDESAIIFAEDADHIGEGRYTIEEMAHRVRTLLISTGLAKQLAPVVVIMGHGSFSTNNPYRSAYDCGACGGRPGRLNSRVFALMANREDVRAKVRESGLEIPVSTHFVGSFHNTCTDDVEYFDLDDLPDSHQKIFEKFRGDVEIARAQNALERCRRFDDVNVYNVAQAIAHVESRAHHIAQPRPEYGHATNAICVVGRREITQGLFLDRRSFLVSYDKTIDPEIAALRNLLRAVIPVCMGINLEYLFSALDNQKYGAGTKLPHNVTSLLGLMTGYCSDLRTGLPAQMVEIHEPTRLLVIIDQEPARVQQIIDSEVDVGRAINNHWVTLMAYSQEKNELYLYDHTNSFRRFEELTVGLKKVRSSLPWVVGKKSHLEFVQIGV